MEKKLIVFDIDGTLLNSKKELLESTIESVRLLKERGHQLCIATGRNRGLAREIVEKVGIDHYICCNGSAAFLNHQLVHNEPLEKSGLSNLIQVATAAKIDLVFQGLDTMCRYQEEPQSPMVSAMESFGSFVPDWQGNFYQTQDVYQILSFHSVEEERVYQDVQDYDFVRWHEKGVDIIPLGGSKAKTIPLLAEKLGMSLKDVIAFGDGNNDREMLRLVGHGVAMGNASDSVKACADQVTSSCDDDGIYLALKGLSLI